MPLKARGSRTKTKPKGTTSIKSQSGWVQSCKRLMADTPWVTSGITTRAQIR
jgi:hypothetical protein